MQLSTQVKTQRRIGRSGARFLKSNSTASPDANQLAQLERLAYWLDTAFRVPGLGLRFGLDAILDLIPGIGDAVGAMLSLYIFQAARRFGVPRVTLIRMAINIAIDYVGGLLPIAGAIFDAYWKANLWNVGLIKRHLATNPQQFRRAVHRDLLFVIAIVAVLILMMATTLALMVWVMSLVVRRLR